MSTKLDKTIVQSETHCIFMLERAFSRYMRRITARNTSRKRFVNVSRFHFETTMLSMIRVNLTASERARRTALLRHFDRRVS